jgi:competence protein ComEC
MRGMAAVVLVALVAACGGRSQPATTVPQPPEAPSPPDYLQPSPEQPLAAVCGGGKKLRIAFYDAGQALAALVTLPDGQHVLVDAGESPKRCVECKQWNARVLAGVAGDLGEGGKIDLLWNTHPHSDHLGGVPSVAAGFKIAAYADNGLRQDIAVVAAAEAAASSDGASITVIEPGNATVPLSAPEDVKLTAIVPPSWPKACKSDPNACSILLRIDYCASSVLFTGDAEADEEPLVLDQLEHADLLQVGHHGSNTSTTPPFLAKVTPRYAVISVGKQNEGTNLGYCHPSKSTVDALTEVMGGQGAHSIRAYDASKAKCNVQKPKYWVDAAASDMLWSTARDGEIVLTTVGDGMFARE